MNPRRGMWSLVLVTLGIVKDLAPVVQNLARIWSLLAKKIGIVWNFVLVIQTLGIGFEACVRNLRNRRAQEVPHLF